MIRRSRDGRSALVRNAGEAADMTSGAILAVTTRLGAVPDTDRITETVAASGGQVA